MDALWGPEAASPRGPKPSLSVDAIVRRAMQIADRNGLGAVTMQVVAERLGVTTMALYRYVASKGELVDAMVEAALGEPPAPDDTRDWRSNLAAWARANRSIYERHPWALHAITASPPFGPNQIAWLEAGLRALATSGLRAKNITATVNLVDDHVRGSAQLSLAMAATPKFGEWFGHALQRATTDPRYPTIAAMVAGGVFGGSHDTPWDQFEFGLARVLDGIEALIQAKHSPRGERTAERKTRRR